MTKLVTRIGKISMTITSLIKHSVKKIEEGLRYAFRVITEHKFYKGVRERVKMEGKSM